VIELAAEAGCGAVALTDHDGVAGLAEAHRRADALGIRFIPGCEVSCAFEPGTMHVLCYFVGEQESPLTRELAVLRTERERRNAEMLERFAELGIPITFEELAAEAGSSVIGRPHLAAVLVRRGIVDSIDEAFARFLAKGAPGYVEKDRVGIESVIALTRASGGVAVLAHPRSLELDREALDHELGGLADAGLTGMECHYASYDQATRADLAALARRHGLVPTGGSDFHGRFKPDLWMGIGRGDLNVPDDVVDELAAAAPTSAD